MRNDQELSQLFRAHLPIAALPKDFADRLTKAVLDEVAQLRQDHTLTKACPDMDLEGPTAFPTRATPSKPTTLPCTSKAVTIFLVLSCLLWPFMQGCTFPATATVSQSVAVIDVHGINNPLAHMAFPYPAGKQSSTHAANAQYSAQRIAQPWRLPPLLPIQPQLPIVQFRQRALGGKPKLTLIATPSSDSPLINLHGPPGVTPTISTVLTLTVPYEPPLTTQDTPPDQPAEPTPIPPEQPQIETPTNPTATPAVEIPIIKPTTLPTELTVAPAPTLSIFEPTATPTSFSEEPTGATPDIPTATATICLLPWQPDGTTPTDASAAGETPTSVPIP